MSSWIKLVALLSLFCVSGVHAQDRLAQLERELDLQAEEGHRERIGLGIMALTLGGTLLPAGIVMTHRHEQLVRLIGIGATVTGAVQFTLVPGLFVPSVMERVRSHHQRRKASGLSPDALLAETEREWAAEATREHNARRWVGIFHASVSAATIPIGLTFMLRHHVGDLSQPKQINIGSTLLGIGIGYMAIAGQLLFVPGRAERSWKMHDAKRPMSFGVAPTASGALLTASGQF